MLQIHDGQCGLCAHFGEEHPKSAEIIQIRTKRSASEQFVDDCGHPKHAQLHLKVTPISGCEGFVPAPMN